MAIEDSSGSSAVLNGHGSARDRLTLNIAPITFSARRLVVGRLPYEDEEQYRELRDSHRQTHIFRFDGRENCILNLPLVPGASPLGTESEVDTSEHLLLLGKAIQQVLFRWLAPRRTVMRPARPLMCWGRRDADLLSKALREAKLPPKEGLEVVVRHSFDTRVLRSAGNDAVPFLVLVLDVNTSNVVDLPISTLMDSGMRIVGKYVCRRGETGEEHLRPRLETVGRISSVAGKDLLLTDTTICGGRVAAEDVILEPRQEHLDEVVRLLFPSRAQAILERVRQLRSPYTSGRGKLTTIRQTLDGLRNKLCLEFGSGLSASLGALLQEGDALFPAEIGTSRPTFLFGPQGRETGSVPDAGIRSFGPYKYMQNERNEPLVGVVCEAAQRGRVEQFAETLRSGFNENAWREATKSRRKPVDNPFRGGLTGKFRLQRVQLEFETVSSATAEGYRAAVSSLLQRLHRAPDLAIVQTKKEHELLRAPQNPYLVAKAAFMHAGVPVQNVHIETMEMPPGNFAYVANNIALASYAKLNGIPWVMSTRGPATHELVVGLGYSEVSEDRLGPRSRYVGITTVFQGDGRYVVWGQTREVEFENYAEALLETLRSTIRYVREENNWRPGDHVRLVFHVYKPLKHREIDAIKTLVTELVSEQHPVAFAFLDISRHHEYQLFDPRQSGVEYYRPSQPRGMKGVFVPARGTALQLSARSALLQLIGPDQVKTDFQGAPRPLLIDLHPDSDFADLTYLVRQIFHFSFMSWRTFFPSVEPVTILYSRLIANALGNLNLVPGWRSDVLTVGALRNSKWFL